MKRLVVFFVAMFCAALVVWSLALAAQPAADVPRADDAKAVERYLPDRHPRPWPDQPTPKPNRRNVLHADTIILEGRDCRIVLDVTAEQPGITLQSRRTGERAMLYLGQGGRAVVGVATPARRDLAAGMFAAEREGVLQLSDPWGVHVLSGQELAPANRRRGAVGGMPKQ